MKKLLILPFFLVLGISALAQDSTKTAVTFNLNADLVNRYVWRGLLFSPNVNIQPYFGISYAGLSFSTWGSYGISDQYAEIDFTLSYNYSNLTLSINDYYNEREDSLAQNKHFNWNRKTTPHALEAAIIYKFSEDFPLTLSIASYFYGNDKKADGSNLYSSYFEVAYPFTYTDYSFNLFLGGTPSEGLYASEAAIVNAGISISKNIKITDAYNLPLSASLISNPNAEDIFLTFKITF